MYKHTQTNRLVVLFFTSQISNSPLSQTHLKGFYKSPQKSPNAFPPAQQFDQSHHSEQAEEGDGDASAVLCVLKRRRRRVIGGGRDKE